MTSLHCTERYLTLKSISVTNGFNPEVMSQLEQMIVLVSVVLNRPFYGYGSHTELIAHGA